MKYDDITSIKGGKSKCIYNDNNQCIATGKECDIRGEIAIEHEIDCYVSILAIPFIKQNMELYEYGKVIND